MGKPPQTAFWQLEYLHPHRKGVRIGGETKRYHLVVGLPSTKRRVSESVKLNGGWKLFVSGALSKHVQAGVGILKGPGCQTVCQIVFLGDHGSAYY